jgi:hypothetical protein
VRQALLGSKGDRWLTIRVLRYNFSVPRAG